MHIQEHNDYPIQWQEVSYLEYEEDWKERKIQEALHNNAMDSKEITNLERGFEMYHFWNKLNPTSKTLLKKKGKS